MEKFRIELLIYVFVSHLESVNSNGIIELISASLTTENLKVLFIYDTLCVQIVYTQIAFEPMPITGNMFCQYICVFSGTHEAS